MAVIRVAISAALGVLVTFALIILMYKLIDSGNKDLDEKEAIKIPEFVQVDRDLTENVKQTQIEKPEDPETPPPDLPDDNIEFEVPENAISMAAPAANANLKLSGTGGFARDSDYIPVYVPQPEYPRRAQTRGKEGYAVIEVIITTTGGTRDPILIEEFPEGWGFGKAALKAASKLKYNPRVVDGIGQEVPGVLYKFTFQMAN
jgi:protein TonB